MAGEGPPAISQCHLSPLGQEGGLQVSGFSSWTARGIACCGGTVGWAALTPQGPAQSPGTECPRLACFIGGPRCCF